jgi:hypothetical protein
MRFHPFLRFGTLLLVAAVPLAAKAQFQPPSQEELKMTSDPKAPGAAAVVLYREETEDDPHNYRSVYARIKVLTKKGEDAATVRIRYPRNLVFKATGDNSSRSSVGANGQVNSYFDPPSLQHTGEDMPYDVDTFKTRVEVAALEARTIQPDGTIIPLKGSVSEILKTVKGANKRNELVFTLPDVQVGSILEYRYQLRYDRYSSAPDWQIQQPWFVHKAHYVFTPTDQFLPDRTSGGEGSTSNSQLMGPHDTVLSDIRSTNILPPGKSLTQDAMGRYILDLTDIPPIPQEPFAPPLAEKIYQVDFYYTYTLVEKEYWQKEMQFWNKDLDRYIGSSSEIKNLVSEVCSPSDAPLDKAKKLYTLVQKFDNIDFSSAVPPPSAGDSIPEGHVDSVLAKKSGTSSEMAFLYLAFLRAAGVNARPERLASRDLHTFSPQILSTAQLDAVVIALNIDGKEILVDPGEKMAPFQTLHWAHTGAGGIALDASGKVEIVVTPLSLYTDNAIVRVGKIDLTPQGQASGTIKIAFTGQEALRWRQLALHTSPEEIKTQLDNTLASQVPAGIQAHLDHFANLDNPNAQLMAIVQVSGSLAAPAGNRFSVPRLFFDSRETDPFPAEASRTLPIDMHYAGEEQEQITYQLPAGFSLEGTPQETKFNFATNATYIVRSRVDANSVTTTRVLARGFTTLDPADYDGLRDFYQKTITADQQQLLMNVASPAGH